MHWNVALDALPGSAMFVHVLDRWLNDWSVIALMWPVAPPKICPTIMP